MRNIVFRTRKSLVSILDFNAMIIHGFSSNMLSLRVPQYVPQYAPVRVMPNVTVSPHEKPQSDRPEFIFSQ